MNNITLDNVEDYAVPISEHPLKWMFESSTGVCASPEVRKQVIPLQKEAAKFLLDFQNTQKHIYTEICKESNFAKDELTFCCKKRSNEAIQKWLRSLNIPLDRKVFWVNQLNVAFVMTWRMVITYSDVLFFGTDEVLWDKTMNWQLSFSADEEFHFSNNMMYNPTTRVKEKELIEQIINVAEKHFIAEEVKEKRAMLNGPIRVQDNEIKSNPSKIFKVNKLSIGELSSL